MRLVHIRPESEFEAGHLPSAINIPMSERPASVDVVAVACPIGQSSVQVARLIDSFEAVGDQIAQPTSR